MMAVRSIFWPPSTTRARQVPDGLMGTERLGRSPGTGSQDSRRSTDAARRTGVDAGTHGGGGRAVSGVPEARRQERIVGRAVNGHRVVDAVAGAQRQLCG